LFARSADVYVVVVVVDRGDVDETLPPVRDAILDRCGTYHGILDVSVDSAMQVYIYQ